MSVPFPFLTYSRSIMNFNIPQGIQRAVLISNVKELPYISIYPGDLIVEFNRAVHHDYIPKTNQILKYLLVRHNREKHFLPDNFQNTSTSWDNIILTSPLFGLSTEDWFKDYIKHTNGKTPTTGFAAYKMIRNRRPKLPIIGLGFNLDDTTSPHNPMHDWNYEYQIYKGDKNFITVSK